MQRNELRQLINDPDNPEIALIGRMRLAKILLYQSKYQEVLDLLEGSIGHAFETKFSELIGDAYYGSGRIFKCRVCLYECTARIHNSPQVVDAALVQMKINDLPENSISDVDDIEVNAQ